MANGRRPRAISVPGSSVPQFGIPGFQVPQVDVSNLFDQQQENLFNTINKVIQLRRKSEREAQEDELVRKKFDLESRKTDAQISKLEAETSRVGVSPLSQLGGIFGGEAPPGTKMTVDSQGRPSVTFPINRELTEGEAKTVAAGEQFQDEVAEAVNLIETGVLGKGKRRVANQFLAQGGGSGIARLLTPDQSNLEKIASLHSRIKRAAFAEGGKQLTPSEQKIVFAGLDFIGKSDEQIITDLRRSISVLVAAGKLVEKGASALDEIGRADTQPRSVRLRTRQREQASRPQGINVGRFKVRVKE